MDIFRFCCAIEDMAWNPAEEGWLPLIEVMPPLGTASTPGGSYIPLAGTPGPAELGAPAPTARLLEFELSCSICPEPAPVLCCEVPMFSSPCAEAYLAPVTGCCC